jgi:hypothetical protein
MARRCLVLLLALSSGCALEWGGATEHRPAIQSELEADRPHTSYRETWHPDRGDIERGILESVRDGGPPRDDSPTFLGPSHTVWANGTADRPGVSDPKELRSRLEEHEERASAHVEEERKGPEPSPAAIGRAVEAWQEWQVEHGIAPIDLSPLPPPPRSDKKGP